MTPEEKFVFDLDGYLLIKNVLTAAEVAELNAIADEKFPRPEGAAGQRTSRVSRWGPAYQALMDHPKILPYLVELIDSKFRLDHDYCIFMSAGDKGGNLHGGEGHEGDHWYKYRDGVMRNGLCVVEYMLTPVRKGDGGFACVPGTHKSNFLTGIPPEVRRFERPAHYVVQPEAEPGDVIFFTEALVHGTMTWRAQHERRALLYKYSPGHSAWSMNYYNVEEFENLTEQQRRILRPPSVGRRPPVIQPEA
jgi:hypothetical protein